MDTTAVQFRSIMITISKLTSGADPGFGRGEAPEIFFQDLPTARSDCERAKRA